VRVIYSREGEPADDVIARLARTGGAAVVVVSSDRAVQAAARAAGGVALSCGEFTRKLAELGGRPFVEELPVEQEGREEPERPDRAGQLQKRGNPRRRSKVARRKEAKLKKL
jgi:predicted RNA-binding protein with PIN domain